MLDAYRALKFARTAGGALKDRFFGNMRAEEGRFRRGTVCIEVGPKAQDYFFRVQFLARVEGGAVLRAAPAFDARERLKGIELRDVFPVDESEILISGKFRDVTELRAFQENGNRAQDKVQMLGVRDQRKERKQCEGVRPTRE